MINLLRNLLVCGVLASLLGAPAFAQAQTRIGTIDLRKVFDNYWKRKQADAAIKERASNMEKEHTAMVADWKKMRDDYQALLSSAKDPVMSEEQRAQRSKAADEKLKQIKASEESINQYERTARETITEQLKRLRENILGEIRTVINAKALAGGYTLVIDTAAETPSNTPIILFSNNKDVDLTDAVLSQLNSTAPADTAKPVK